jgi:hypothetical protein
MGWIHAYPRWLVAILTIAIFAGTAFAGLATTRSWSRQRGMHALVDNGVIGWIFSAILGIYAIAIGLIAVASWNNESQAASVASKEAAAIAGLYRDFTGYPEPTGGQLRAMLAEYARDVVDKAWPLQRAGEIPHGGTDVLNRLQKVLYGFEPATDGKRILHAAALESYNRMIECRRQRLEAVDYAVPGTLWSVVLVGAAISIVASFVFSIESFQVHALMTCLLAAIVGLLVFFIAVTDRPYRGADSVSPEAYELVIRDLMDDAGHH